MDGTVVIIGLVVSFVCWVASSILKVNFAKKTGLAVGVGFLIKVLGIVSGAGIFLMMPIDGEIQEFFWLGILVVIVCFGLVFLLNLKSKNIGMNIAITACTVIGGAFALFALVLEGVARLAPIILGQGGGSGGFLAFLNQDNKVRATAAARKEELRAAENEKAEAVAQHEGFSSADEAEAFGVKTGKKYN